MREREAQRNNGFSAKPQGVLPCTVVDIVTHTDESELPHFNWLKGKDVVFEISVLPEGHDKIQKLYIPVVLETDDDNQLIMTDNGIAKLYDMLDSLGLGDAEFNADGRGFKTHDNQQLEQLEDIAVYLLENVMRNPSYRLYTHVYKETNKEGVPKFFKVSRFFVCEEKDKPSIEKLVQGELDYEANKAKAKQKEQTVVSTAVRGNSPQEIRNKAFSRKI